MAWPAWRTGCGSTAAPTCRRWIATCWPRPSRGWRGTRTAWRSWPMTSTGSGRPMNAATRNEIIRRWRADASIRQIARDLNVSRNTVSRVLAEAPAQRDGTPAAPPRRPSLLDPFDAAIQELLGRYPDLTATRLLEELRHQGFTGG